MSDLFSFLFGLERLSLDDPDVRLGAVHPLAMWAWVLIGLGALAWAGWSYWRLVGPAGWRGSLAVVRTVAILLVVLLLTGPRLVRPNERVEQDWVLVLADRSASMAIADIREAGGTRQSRDAALRGALESSGPMWESLASERTIVWLGFDDGAYEIDLPEGESVPSDLSEPGGRRTNLGRSIEQALARATARPLAGVVVLSDGRSSDRLSRAVMRRLQSQRVPIFTVPLGSEQPLEDLAIRSVEAPRMAFIDDVVVVKVDIERTGTEGESILPDSTVRLVDAETGLTLEETPLRRPGSWDGPTEQVTLTTASDIAGSARWRVELVLPTPDLVAQNNTRTVDLELVDRPVRVLYVDGYPRWEYRYLKNILIREGSIESASMLLAAGKRFMQEGDVTIDSLPRSPEEWSRFDVVVIGDVRPDLFSPEQLEQLRDHVAYRGAGLLWIGGSGATPSLWAGTALGDLVPFVVDEGLTTWREPVTIQRAAAADELGVLRMGDDPREPWPERLSRPETGWSQLWWAQRISDSAVKPTAEVLAYAVPNLGIGGGSDVESDSRSPLVLTMRYGAGRVIYIGTDEIWRWRYGRGEALEERFWLPMIRVQARESLSRSGRPATIEVEPRRATVDQAVRVGVRLLDQALLDAKPGELRARVRRKDSAGGGSSTPLVLEPELGQPGEVSRAFATTWIASTPGEYVVEVIDPLLGSVVAAQDLAAEVSVRWFDDELRQPATDHVHLASLASETGGEVVPPAQLSDLADLLPNREVRLAGAPDVETLWDKPFMLIALITLLTLEWVGRKLLNLV